MQQATGCHKLKEPDILYLDFGVAMAEGLNGVGLRACELAAAFSQVDDVVVVSPDEPHPDIRAVWPDLRFLPRDAGSIAGTSDRDILLYGFATDPDAVERFRAAGGRTVFDAIVWPLEYLTYQSVRSAPDPADAYTRHLQAYLRRLQLADRFLVASQTEKRVLAGTLATISHPVLTTADSSLDDVVAILPVGFSKANENTATTTEPNDPDAPPMFVWNGGLWNHYAPTAAIDALAAIHREGHDARLWFLYPRRGTPTATYRATVAAAQARPELADKVSFVDGGLSLADRVTVLRHATASICLYRPHALWDLCPPMRMRETLVYRLPVIAPDRGALGGVLRKHGCGAIVADLTTASVAAAMRTCLNPELNNAMRTAATRMTDDYDYDTLVPHLHPWLTERRR